jgi:hypothetical protein
MGWNNPVVRGIDLHCRYLVAEYPEHERAIDAIMHQQNLENS